MKASFFLLSIFVDELISATQIIKFLPVPPIRCEENPCLSNPIPYAEYLYLSIIIFFVKITAPNKQFSNVG